MNKCCANCGNDFKTRVNLEKHAILCDFLHKSKQKQEEDLQFELPSQRVMYELLMELGQKYNRLEEKMDSINKFVMKKKKQINVLEWLNNNVTPEQSFEQLLDTIHVTREDVERIFEESVFDIMNSLFAKFIYDITQNQ